MTDWSTPPQPSARADGLPNADRWPDADLIAVGGNLEPATLITAYRHGMFPMEVTALQGSVGWWSPERRGIVPLDASARDQIDEAERPTRFEVRFDTCFGDVDRACANPSRGGGWITERFLAACTNAAPTWAGRTASRCSIETVSWPAVSTASASAGSSPASRCSIVRRDASKVALMALVESMRDAACSCSTSSGCTDHLASLGAIEIARGRVPLRSLADAVESR